MTDTVQKEVSMLYSNSRKKLDICENYLKSRRLNLFKNVGYVDNYLFNGKVIINSILMFITDTHNNITKVITRSLNNNEYNIIYKNNDSLPCYNIDSIVNNNLPIILTESILDAETINQNLEFATSISFATASLTAKEKAFFNCLIYGRKTYICFDNDFSGMEQTKNLIKYCEVYGNKLRILNITHKDVNNFYMRCTKSMFINHMRDQIII